MSIENTVWKCNEVELADTLAFMSKADFELVSAVAGSDHNGKCFWLFFTKNNHVTTINNVFTESAKKVVKALTAHRFKVGDKVEMVGWFAEPIVVKVDQMYPNGDGFIGSNEMGNFHVPYAADQLTLKKVKS